MIRIKLFADTEAKRCFDKISDGDAQWPVDDGRLVGFKWRLSKRKGNMGRAGTPREGLSGGNLQAPVGRVTGAIEVGRCALRTAAGMGQVTDFTGVSRSDRPCETEARWLTSDSVQTSAKKLMAKIWICLLGMCKESTAHDSRIATWHRTTPANGTERRGNDASVFFLVEHLGTGRHKCLKI